MGIKSLEEKLVLAEVESYNDTFDNVALQDSIANQTEDDTEQFSRISFNRNKDRRESRAGKNVASVSNFTEGFFSEGLKTESPTQGIPLRYQYRNRNGDIWSRATSWNASEISIELAAGRQQNGQVWLNGKLPCDTHEYDATIQDAAALFGLPPSLLLAILMVESSMKTSAERGAALGLGQLQEPALTEALAILRQPKFKRRVANALAASDPERYRGFDLDAEPKQLGLTDFRLDGHLSVYLAAAYLHHLVFVEDRRSAVLRDQGEIVLEWVAGAYNEGRKGVFSNGTKPVNNKKLTKKAYVHMQKVMLCMQHLEATRRF
ncbi:MAG: hypothetical protein A2289_06790 [Deltaproteobacteria bacterium RIFOXYA12_FULL_58_15]|nr:MAG: hypothetical protein A2289_06790 [Deltaproteobacteria bacterium RIFOXYA12_FULL_58_15]OGR14193.1 MAG: hypothetical protein A2341_26585 [Deltaproteobacteria bacterium RIFOXYB12_FULL_58_9]